MRGERGAVSLEFVIAVMPVLLVFLGLVQLVLVGTARLVVAHAAVMAARSAAVVLDDDPGRYGGEARGHLGSARHEGGTELPSSSPGPGLLALIGRTGAVSRLEVIRRAAAAPLAPFAPSTAEVLRWRSRSGRASVRAAVAGRSADRTLLGLLWYPEGALALTFPAPGAPDLVRVRVAYLFHCAVPIVPWLLCDTGTHWKAEVPAPAIQRLISASGERFLVLEAEANSVRQRPFGAGAS